MSRREEIENIVRKYNHPSTSSIINDILDSEREMLGPVKKELQRIVDRLNLDESKGKVRDGGPIFACILRAESIIKHLDALFEEKEQEDENHET